MTKFIDMPIGSRNGWLAWANEHDWGGEHAAWYDKMTGEIVTYGCERRNELWYVIEVRHKTPQQMKAWAGY